MEHTKLLIVGAGVSGIAAAARLLECGFNNFKIIEAESRVGGRIHTTLLGGQPIELGAEWIHGEVGNVVYELASKQNLTSGSNTDGLFNLTKFFDSSGKQINKDISFALTSAYSDIMKLDEKSVNEETLKGSIGDHFEIEFQKAITELNKKLIIDDKLSKKFLKTFENWENSIDGSHSWYETSLNGHLQYKECPGDSLTTWRNRHYDTLFDLIIIPDCSKKLSVYDKIDFNKEVTKIKWNKDCKLHVPNVEVQCTDGSIYLADRILFTCSLGVLKEKAATMFTPAVTEKKLKSIQNLGFGTVDKIFLGFRQSWWEDQCDGFGFLWSEEERKNDSSGWLSGVICFHPVCAGCPILRGWITAEAAQKMEMLSNEEVVQGLNYLLEKFLGVSYSVPKIVNCLISKWHSSSYDPHFRGSYSCRLIKSEKSNISASDLAEPLFNNKGMPIVLFAGEATHDHYFSTVHGAIESGQREADRILSVLNKPVLKKYYQVVIVGAGISGLSAAKTLHDNGVTDIVILEAQNKPGGRISSVKFEESFLELGAQWIHGEKNEVFRICQANGLLTQEYSCEGEGLYLRENGQEVDKNVVREVDDIIKDILENCENYISCNGENDIPHSIGQELVKKFNDYLESCKKDTLEVKKLKKDLFDWHNRFQLIDNSCSDLHNLSARAWGLFKFCGGNDYINFRNGYSSLIDFLTHYFPADLIRCNTPVKKIEWTKSIQVDEPLDSKLKSNYNDLDCNIKITCENGETTSCQHVIVTSSLGFLKHNHKKMFHPPLPSYLSEAIEYLDFGVIDKIFLIYERPWWKEEVKGFQLVWSQEESSCPEERKHWGKYVTGFDVILKNKPILLGWIGGEGAKEVERLPEVEVGREATEILRNFTGDTSIPFPRQVIRTKWWCNEYVKGGYSHITVKCDEKKINGSNLAQPVVSTVNKNGEIVTKPTILLAGESTHKYHFSTVHGAYESGQNQARVILKHLHGL